jgi:hypothetical protein
METLVPNKVAPKLIYSYFSGLHSLILITCDGEILVYDKTLSYVGSYFTLHYQTLVECLSCHDKKYLYFLHENNDMQVVNIYTQDQLISVANMKERVGNIFFCHSQVYFCGYFTSKKYELVIYGYPDERYTIRNANAVQPVIEILLTNLFQELVQPAIKVGDKETASSNQLQKKRTIL